MAHARTGCSIDEDWVKPDGQNSVISFVISKWLLPELSIPAAGQKDRRLWGREWDCDWPSTKLLDLRMRSHDQEKLYNNRKMPWTRYNAGSDKILLNKISLAYTKICLLL